MTKTEEYEKRTEELLMPIMERFGFELVDVEYVKEGSNKILRAYIDKEGGINIDDCEAVSRALSDALDKDDFIDEAYILEVSSPGLGRPLKKDKDFARSIGQEVDVKLYRAIGGEKTFTGILKSWDDKEITIEINTDTEMTIKRSDISLIRLAFDF